MTIHEALDYIHETAWQNQTPGLHRIRTLLQALGNPQDQLRFVHVAGTNGKGSTCACISAILRQAGYRVGLNTSPYIHRFNERIQINGAEIDDDALVDLVASMAPVVEGLDFRPTEFELITALAFLHFAQERCDIVVLEVGLGGALDASNVIDCPEVAVITSLGFDHTAILGHTMAEIAAAKAGIIKSGGTVVYQDSDPIASAVIAQQCTAQQATLHLVDTHRMEHISADLLHPNCTITPYGQLTLGLAGAYQPGNALLAITAVEVLVSKGYAITPVHIVQGLSAVRWPGRCEVLARAPLVVLDGAHNPQGMAATAQTLTAYPPAQVVLGLLEDKDVDTLCHQVTVFAHAIHCVTPPSPRALDAGTLAQKLTALGCTAMAYESVPQAMKAALTCAGQDGLVVALGSLYLCADVRDYFKNTN